MEDEKEKKGDKVSNKTRAELNARNREPKRPDSDEVKRLDGSIKKTTGFIRKLKTGLNAEGVEALKKEILTLKLEKYLDEIAAAIGELVVEKKLSNANVWAAVEVVSLVHQRFDGFDALAVEMASKAVASSQMPSSSSSQASVEIRDREELSRLARLRVALRLVTEFYLVGLAKDPSKDLFIPALLRPLFNWSNDKEFANASIAAHFCKTFESVFLGDKSLTEESIIRDDVRIAVKAQLVDYYHPMSKYLVKMHKVITLAIKYIRKAEVSNYEHAVARGEVSEERQERFQRGLKLYEKLLSSCQSVASSLGLEMPDLPEPESADKLSIGISYTGSKETDDQDALQGGPWEDEESRSFYENVIDLKDMVPSILLGEKQEKPAAPTAADLEKLNSVIQVNDEAMNADVPNESSKLDGDEAGEDTKDGADDAALEDEDAADDDDKTSKSNTTGNKVALDAFFTNLPNALSVESVDKLAVEFCYINSKATRKRLIKTLSTVPRQRLDLLPYYARLIATLSPFMPDISTQVLAALEKAFHFHQKKTDRTFVEEKVKVVRFIGELTKFKLPPYHVIFHVFKLLLESFTPHNIEAICSLLEVCGRFLYKTPETSKPTSNVLEIMMKKKSVLNLDSRMVLLIDNAFYQCNPPERPAIQHKTREPMDLYIRKLFYTDLSKRNSERILKQLRKLNWTDPNLFVMVRKRFVKCWKVKYANLHVLALLAVELSRFYPAFGISVVNGVLEEIRLGLETNLFKQNQRRISCARFLGEMYNYRLVESSTVFDTLYLLLRFGYESPFPEPGVYSHLDAPHDFFRVRLCCVIMETCGQCFDRGVLAQKLDEFLAFLQVYVHSKPRLSMEVEFLISETLELLRPKKKLCKDYDEAVDEFNVLAMRYAQQDPNTETMPKADLEQSSDDEEQDDDEIRNHGGAGSAGEEEGPAAHEEDVHADVMGQEDDEDVVVHLPEREVDKEFEEEFEKEFSKMMLESLESRKFDKKSAAFDVSIPVKRAVAFQGPPGGAAQSAGTEGVVFSFLTKKGNKQQLKAVELPQDSSFVQSTKQKQEADRAEKQQLKKLVLSYEDRDQDDELVPGGAGPSKITTKSKKQVLFSTERQRKPNPPRSQYGALGSQLE
ncbi:hypothetical protein CcCBS67573_g01935 [Chytriomyces confervae]|uniref:MIF4G domain-containing protein n=1 Tax=Chytriomyces confervae TaxID=246404 RepID=A0A507FKF5_9FUNG|nr:hypothetical protein CcCBS67573_g01935 [Chytriomyces confervae]